MTLNIRVPGTQGLFTSTSGPQRDIKSKLWVFNNDVEGSLIDRVEIIANGNNTFELEAFCSKSNLDTMKNSFTKHFKKPEFVDDEMSRMRLKQVDDVREMVLWLIATQRIESADRMTEVVIELPKPN